ncbi:hypothetical protein EVAR_85180_1 [Eumeta japonica]|uniref:Uncharacterized protein n=1 Tax=Eumeta variegata TaxID=151549 RepID=A0A4C1VXN0_EUMVA|nr:hypothetical protein EVAR_85180_1 [Eumeta japonica]
MVSHRPSIRPSVCSAVHQVNERNLRVDRDFAIGIAGDGDGDDVSIPMFSIVSSPKMPTTAEGWLAIENGFRRKFPHCIGSLDGVVPAALAPTDGTSRAPEMFNVVSTTFRT